MPFVTQHIHIIAANVIRVNHFLLEFRFCLPELLGEIFAMGFDGTHAVVQNSSDTTKSNSGHYQPKYKSDNEFAHDISLNDFNTVQLGSTGAVGLHSSVDQYTVANCQLFSEGKKHSSVVASDSSGIPGIPLLTIIGLDHFHIQCNLVANGTHVLAS